MADSPLFDCVRLLRNSKAQLMEVHRLEMVPLWQACNRSARELRDDLDMG